MAGEEKLEFYGQRPWRPGKLNAEPADMMREASAIQALQYKEKMTVNHSVRDNEKYFFTGQNKKKKYYFF